MQLWETKGKPDVEGRNAEARLVVVGGFRAEDRRVMLQVNCRHDGGPGCLFPGEPNADVGRCLGWSSPAATAPHLAETNLRLTTRHAVDFSPALSRRLVNRLPF